LSAFAINLVPTLLTPFPKWLSPLSCPLPYFAHVSWKMEMGEITKFGTLDEKWLE